MNPLEELGQHIRDSYPNVVVELSKPRWPDGFWQLDLISADKIVFIQWNSQLHFGLSIGIGNYGEGPDENNLLYDQVIARLKELF